MSPEEIKDLRQKLGVSQNSFARMVGVTQITVYNWEKGKTQPPETTQILLNLFKRKVEEKSKTPMFSELLKGGAGGVGGVAPVFIKILEEFEKKPLSLRKEAKEIIKILKERLEKITEDVKQLDSMEEKEKSVLLKKNPNLRKDLIKIKGLYEKQLASWKRTAKKID